MLRPALGFSAEGGSGEARNADQFRSGLRSERRSRLCRDRLRGRGSVARLLTGAVASGCGEKGETGLLRTFPSTL